MTSQDNIHNKFSGRVTEHETGVEYPYWNEESEEEDED